MLYAVKPGSGIFAKYLSLNGSLNTVIMTSKEQRLSGQMIMRYNLNIDIV